MRFPRLKVSVALLALVLSVAPASAQYRHVATWGGSGTDPGKFNRAFSLTVDPKGNVFVIDQLNNRVQKFSSTGEHLVDIFGLQQPFDLAISKVNNELLVTNPGGHCVQRCTFEGGSGSTIGSAAEENGGLTSPTGITVDQIGYVYVGDMSMHVAKFDRDGRFLGSGGSQGSANGQINGPVWMAIDGQGNLYVSDQGNNRIQKFSSIDGSYLGGWGSSGSGSGQFNSPCGIAIDVNKSIVYVADRDNHRIQYFDLNGAYLGQWGSLGSDKGQFVEPVGIGLSSDGFIYVSDANTNLVQKFVYSPPQRISWGALKAKYR